MMRRRESISQTYSTRPALTSRLRVALVHISTIKGDLPMISRARKLPCGFALSTLLGLVLACAWGPPIAVADPVVVTQQGRVSGVESSEVREFLGIPYA